MDAKNHDWYFAGKEQINGLPVNYGSANECAVFKCRNCDVHSKSIIPECGVTNPKQGIVYAECSEDELIAHDLENLRAHGIHDPRDCEYKECNGR